MTPLCNSGPVRFWRHQWTHWRVEGEGQIFAHVLSQPDRPKIQTGMFYIQARECERCGFKQIRKIKP